MICRTSTTLRQTVARKPSCFELGYWEESIVESKGHLQEMLSCRFSWRDLEVAVIVLFQNLRSDWRSHLFLQDLLDGANLKHSLDLARIVDDITLNSSLQLHQSKLKTQSNPSMSKSSDRGVVEILKVFTNLFTEFGMSPKASFKVIRNVLPSNAGRKPGSTPLLKPKNIKQRSKAIKKERNQF